MFNFNLKKTKIYKAVKWEKFLLFRFHKILKLLLLLLFISFLIVFVYGFLGDNLSKETNRIFLGFSLIFLVSFISISINEFFFNSKIKKPKLKISIDQAILNPEKHNLAEFLSFESAKAVVKAIRSARSVEITSTHLFYFLLKDNKKLKFVLMRALLSTEELKKIIRKEIKSFPLSKKSISVMSQDFQDTILEAFQVAGKKGHFRIEMGDILSALAQKDSVFKEVLMQNKLKADDIYNLVWWFEDIEDEYEKRKRFWDYENLSKRGTLARKWTAGYTITLDKYSNDVKELVSRNRSKFIGYKQEMDMIERVLARDEGNNVLLIGQPGIGKRSIVYALMEKIISGNSLPQNNYKRLVEINMSALLAQIDSVEVLETVLDKIFQEARDAGNIVLVIDGFHNYIGQIPKPGVIDISGIIAPYLKFSQFQVIALATYEGLHTNIERNSSIIPLFQKVEVSEISEKDTLSILGHLAFSLEDKNKVFISYQSLSEIIFLTERYSSSAVFPKKAIDILYEAVVYVANSKRDKIVLPKHIAKIITQKTEIPVGEIEEKEKYVLLNLEKLIHKRIINQNQAVKDISTALRRARSDISVKKGVMGAFLFLGPTGVGKTETAKALAKVYFGSEERIIRLDMSEFQETKDISRIIGSKEMKGLLTVPVKENPFSLILLDELEKANPGVVNLFLQVLDEGHLTDGLGRKIDFKSTIIIATSNAGYKIILEALNRKTKWAEVKEKILGYIFEKGIFRPEFINRFDQVVVFSPLSKENLLAIAELILSKLKKNIKNKEIEFIITEDLKEKIVELSYNP
ncbi:MAG: AAA family ATPase, partial [Patescibacteria group bacterium]|nr:AAA family ATPase [Patescibacteria group bacterium]